MMPADDFHDFAIRLVQPVIRFQSACWGLGYFAGRTVDSGMVPIALRALEIDPQSTVDWVAINRADKVIPIAVAAKNTTCNFHAPTLFDRDDDAVMRDFARRYGRQCYLITVMRGQPGSPVEWLSMYRPDPHDHFSERERAQCQRLVEHLCEASKINRLAQVADAQLLRALDDDPGETPDRNAASSQHEFIARHRITPAEWRVALRIADGRSPVQIADDLSVSLTTVRTHIRSLFGKTGTRRQAQLVAKIAAIRGA